MSEQKIQFLYNAIDDTQSTIRALDIKVGFFLTLLILPFASIDKIINLFDFSIQFFKNYSANSKFIESAYPILFTIFIIAWAASLLMAFYSLIPLSMKKIFNNNKENKNTCFYLEGINNRSNTSFQCVVEKTYEKLPKDDADIINQLICEHIILSILREKKSKNVSYTFLAMSIAITSGVIVASIYLAVK